MAYGRRRRFRGRPRRKAYGRRRSKKRRFRTYNMPRGGIRL